MKKIQLLKLSLFFILFLVGKAHASFQPLFDFTASFNPLTSSGFYSAEKVQNAIWIDGQNSQVAAYVQFAPGHQRYRIEGELSGSNPNLTIVAGFQTIVKNSSGPFSWEGTARQIYFYTGGSSSYSLLAEMEHIPSVQLPACHPDHAQPPQGVCLSWWNSNVYPQRRLTANCLGYAKNQVVYYGGLGPNKQPINFSSTSTTVAAVNKIRSTMSSVHGWTLRSTNVNSVPNVNAYGKIAALMVDYVHGTSGAGRLINDFHVMRKNQGYSYWTEKGGSQPVNTRSESSVKSFINNRYGENIATSSDGGSFFVGYFSIP